MKIARRKFAGILTAGLLLILGGCVQKVPVNAKESIADQPAVISRCDVPIVSVDGRPSTEPIYELSLEPGSHVLVAEYPTLLALYHCTFEVALEAGEIYEVVERPDQYPVFLNRIKKGRFFTTRLEKFPPQECTKIKRRDDS